MSRLQKYTICARFIITIAHLMSIILVFELKKRNIDVGLGDDASSAARQGAIQLVNVSPSQPVNASNIS